MHLGLVPQGRRVFPSLTVDEHLAIAELDAVQWISRRCSRCFHVSTSAGIIAATS